MASDAPEPQVVQVVLPDGDVEARLASLDIAGGNLVLKQVNFSTGGEVQLGGQAVVKLSSIGHASASGKIVYLHAGDHSGPVLLELHFDSVSVALLWARSLNGSTSAKTSPAPSPQRSPASSGRAIPQGAKASSPTGGRASPQGAKAPSPTAKAPPKRSAPAGPPRQTEADIVATQTLRELVRQQEEQVRLLQEITSRKDEQLLKAQERLEEHLSMLQVGQDMYGKQQRLVSEQAKTIELLRAQLEASDNIAAACNARAAEATAGRAAAKAAQSTTIYAPRSRVPAAASAAASGAQPSPGAAKANRPAQAGAMAQAAAAAAAAAEQDDEDPEAVLAERTAILAKLQTLDAEKATVEADLMSEQNQIFAELKELQNMMAELGIDLNDVVADEA